MKYLIIITILLASLLFTSCSKTDAEKILKKSFEKCQSIENGYYEMTHHMKFMSGNDTSSSSFNCYFKKLPDDSIYSSAFHYHQYYHDSESSRNILYTGDDFVDYSETDSVGEIMSKALWAKDIKSYRHNYTFYTPITDRKSSPLPDDSAFVDYKYSLEYLGEEVINDISCYHVKMNIIPKNDSTNMLKTLRRENNFWINKQDYIPIQYTIAYDLVMNNDTMYQFQKEILTKYELNNLKDEPQLSLSSIPSYITLKDYKPYKSPELLPKDTVAPLWSLVSLKDDTLNLSDLKGHLVLIDFFYKGCYPCILALPALQDLHERYYDKGLRVIGINPYDTEEKDNIDEFLFKQGVSYTVLLGGEEVAKEYRVSGYPTVYFIDKEGKILYTQVGYGEGVEKELEEIIKQNL